MSKNNMWEINGVVLIGLALWLLQRVCRLALRRECKHIKKPGRLLLSSVIGYLLSSVIGYFDCTWMLLLEH